VLATELFLSCRWPQPDAPKPCQHGNADVVKQKCSTTDDYYFIVLFYSCSYPLFILVHYPASHRIPPSSDRSISPTAYALGLPVYWPWEFSNAYIPYHHPKCKPHPKVSHWSIVPFQAVYEQEVPTQGIFICVHPILMYYVETSTSPRSGLHHTTKHWTITTTMTLRYLSHFHTKLDN